MGRGSAQGTVEEAALRPLAAREGAAAIDADALWSRVAGRRWLTPAGLFGIGAAIIAVTMVGLYLGLLRDGLQRAQEHAHKTTRGVAQAIASELDRTLAPVERLLAELGGGAGPAAGELGRRRDGLPPVRVLMLLDGSGSVVQASEPGLLGTRPLPLAWLDRLSETARRTVPAPTELGPPLAPDAARDAAGGWVIPLGRARTGAEPGFIVALLDGERLRGALRQTAFPFDSELRLLAASGTLLLATDLPAGDSGRDEAGSAVFTRFPAGTRGGTWQGEQDGQIVIASFARGQALPFLVSASVPRDVALAPWRVEGMTLAASFAVMGLVVLAALWLLFRQANALRLQGEQLAHSERRAQAAGRAKQEFLAAMSHEIRTPMNGVIGMAGLLMETRLDPEQHRYTSTIQSSAEHLLTVLNDILDFSKIEAGAVELESTPFVLEEEVATITELFGPATGQKGVELVCRLGTGLPEAVIGDPGRFRQIMLNLVGNAAKFTHHGWIEIALEGTNRPDGTMELACTISDTGIGIDPARIPMLFERFSQADASISRHYGGTGLGLAICRRLVEAMGGEIGAAPRPGGGSIFRFTIAVHPHDGPTAAADARPLAGRRCLVVDDLPLNREILLRQLEAMGARAEAAEDGVAALAQLRRAATAADPFAFVLVDRVMPVMDGISFARAVRQDAALAAGPPLRLVLCASGHLGELRDGIELFDAQLIKPVMGSRLRRVAAMLETSRLAAPAPAAPVAEPPPLAGLSILVAEDNATNQLVTRSILQRAGASVEVVEDGHQALSAVAAARYDLVLMDVQMPGMDGLEATRRIRAAEAARNLPPLRIIGLTAAAGAEFQAECREAGMDSYLAKPATRAALLAAILKQTRAAAEPT